MCGPPVLASLWRDARKGSRVESTYDPHLSLCLTYGHVGCCDSSPLRRARAHACAIVQSFEPGGDRRWRCVDEAYV
jgi:hypothetical protein